MCLFRITCTVLAMVDLAQKPSFKIVTCSEHFSGYVPAIAILTSMKLGVAKRRIGANSLGLGKKLIQSKKLRVVVHKIQTQDWSPYLADFAETWHAVLF